jgi:hypothetical protein
MAIKRFLHDQEWLAMKLLGLVRYAATFVTGFFFLAVRERAEQPGATAA